MRWARSLPWLVLLAGCQGARNPPPPQDEPKREPAPLCDKVFPDRAVRGGAACCIEPSIGILKSVDILITCGQTAAAYLGETRDGAACRFHFATPAGNPKQTFVMVSHPVIPAGTPAPVAPDPLLPWRWKKVALRDAVGYEALTATDEPGLLARQTILWAGRGRRIVGLHVSKEVCNEAQAQALLQKAIDAVP